MVKKIKRKNLLLSFQIQFLHMQVCHYRKIVEMTKFSVYTFSHVNNKILQYPLFHCIT